MRRLLLFFFLACCPLPGQSIDEFFESFTTEWVRGNPSQATSLRYFEGEEQDRLDRLITPVTDEYRRTRIALAERGLRQLRAFDKSAMTDVQRVSAELLESQLQRIVESEKFDDYSFPLNQFRGTNTSLPEALMRIHPLATERDAENYVAKLEQVPLRMNEAIERAKRIEAKGLIPPRYILDATIKQMQRFADPAPASNPLATTLASKMSDVPGLSAEKRAALLEQAAKVIGEQIYPAWRRGIALLESQVPRAPAEAGLADYEGGAEAYADRLREFTTTDLSPQQIHDIGLREVARLEAEMDKLFRQLGRTEGTIAERVAQLEKDRMYPEPASEASREQVIKDIEAIVSDAYKRSESLFDKLPKSPMVVQPTPTFQENNAAANYTLPTADGSRPGIYQYPRRADRMSKVTLRSVTYHEGIPGHHFQLALQVENTALPRFRKLGVFGIISAFAEGWGLYAERLVVEQGWYEDDPEGLINALDSQLWRARRLVVDTGLHTMGWTRQQAIDYGLPVSEVERYIVNPGQACSYMIGQLKIVELREKAMAALGDKFSLSEYHNVVLETGRVPLTLLESEVDRYIATKR